eukprot:TRINITY_DN4088_c0_g2_i1.p1 TRINITY_DN4088_c0_g2~~TRINITY_DN4088_c0_g2_i1.p1  ORF type:complete len:313 (-),score=54.96 TRINITY_DN4088_c0_g2_i1:62-1000(-)
MDIKTMIAREKEHDKHAYDRDLLRIVARQDIHDDRMDDVIVPGGTFSRNRRGTKEKQQERHRKRSINAHNRMTSLLEKCQYCFKNKRYPKHLILSLGDHTYLTLAPSGDMMTGHCCIIPLEHTCSSLELDEEVYVEISNFKKSLVRMFQAQGKYVVFTETVRNLQQKFHLVVECFPIPQQAASIAPAYFKKALLDVEGEWSQHKAKSVIDTKAKGGLLKSVPRGFPYFYVDFAAQGGYAHVKDDRRDFKQSFAREVIAGILQLPAENWAHRRRRGFEQGRQAALKFIKGWEKFDWTVHLDGGDYSSEQKEKI